jgi:outer membrane protein TolC
MLLSLRQNFAGISCLLSGLLLVGCATSEKQTTSPTVSQTAPHLTTFHLPTAPLPPSQPGMEPTIQQVEYQAQVVPPANVEASPSDTTPLGKAVAAGNEHMEQERPALPIDFATALGLTQGQNPRVAFAQALVSQAYAQHRVAHNLWLPSIRAGMNYNKHEGRLQDVEGNNMEISRGAAFGGLGANAVGAGSPAIPGIYMNFHTTDAIFQRRITQYAWQARQSQSTAATNDQLLETALAYLTLLESSQRSAITLESLEHGEQLAKLTADFARTGAGNQADADRAQAVLALLRNERLRAEEAISIASARLAQQLSADPTLRIVPQETNVVPIELVAQEENDLSQLVATSLSNRPELSANRALVCEAVNRLEREKFAPWLPSLLLGTSYGGFGAGTGGNITNGGDRFDFDGTLWWEVRNLGAGEKVARDLAQAQIRQARMREIETMDLVAREVVEAATQVQSRRQQIAIAQAGISSARQSYQKNLERIKNAQGLPIEVLQAIQALDSAQREYLRTLVDFNSAQFRLQRALGWPIRDTAAPQATNG